MRVFASQTARGRCFCWDQSLVFHSRALLPSPCTLTELLLGQIWSPTDTKKNNPTGAILLSLFPAKPGHALARLSSFPREQTKVVSPIYRVAARASPASWRRPPLVGRRGRSGGALDLGELAMLGEARARHPSPGSQPGEGTYLVIGSVGGCEIRLVRTIDLVHNIQTAHGSPQRRRFRVLS